VVMSVLFVSIMLFGHVGSSTVLAAKKSCSDIAEVNFGIPGVDFGAANHNLDGNDVCVTKGGTVNYEVYGFHQIAIYKVKADTTRSDVISNPNRFVDTTNRISLVLPPEFGGEVIPDFLINDPNQRVFLDPESIFDHVVSPGDPVNVTFPKPGRYLAICTVAFHFLDSDPAANGGMFGFVDVDVD
jgi:hypothetical protein